MDDIHSLAAIAGVFLLTCFSPGPSFVLISSTAISASRRAGLLVGMGVAGSTLTWSVAVVLGLGLVLARVGWLYQAVRLLGAAYLVWLGLRLVLSAWRNPGIATGVPQALPGTPGHHLRRGYLVAVSNPTAAAYFGSVFSTMLPAQAPPAIHAAAVVVVTVLSLLWHCGIAVVFGVAPVQLAYRRSKRGIDALTGGVLVLLGLRLGASR